MPKLIFGCGYLGQRVAERWLARGETTYVVTRSSEHAQEFEQRGFVPIVADVTRPATLVNLPVVDAVFYGVGFDRTTGLSIHQVYAAGLAAVLDALPESTGKFLYVSSTGVYGQDDGSWVDEQSSCHPQREGGRACLEAERLLTAHSWGSRSVVLRMAGLYGPGRIPRQRELLSGKPLAVPAAGYLNLIHVEDAANVVLAAEERAKPPCTYTVSDGHPVTRHQYYEELSCLLQAPAPRFEAPLPGGAALDRAASDKRVCNERMLAELHVQLTHPSYREGLAAILAAEAKAGKK